jgi:hypothetical protein
LDLGKHISPFSGLDWLLQPYTGINVIRHGVDALGCQPHRVSSLGQSERAERKGFGNALISVKNLLSNSIFGGELLQRKHTSVMSRG